jgi:hypothetical protein
MDTNPACPPIPTPDELFNSGNFIEVSINNLVPDEFVVLSLMNGMAIQCIEIVALNNPVGNPVGNPDDEPDDESDDDADGNLGGTITYRMNGMEWRQSINEFAPPHVRFYRKRPLQSAGKRHRKKSKGTKRTRKNKRKSTRRTGRKYKR